jgi:aminoglycoside 3-N-acetyltransferase I
MSLVVERLGAADTARMRELNAMFARAFAEPESYRPEPSDDYLCRLLGREQLIVLAALQSGEVIGGLVAYLLEKLEQERSEIYIYDLAVRAEQRRQGIATLLIREVQRIAAEAGAWMIFVQADRGDDPAIALYERLGRREEVLHFDISPEATT